MIARIARGIFALLEKVGGRRIFYYTPSKYNCLGNTAVKASAGFWYVGNVYDTSDVAYGIVNNGVVEEHETALVYQILDIIAKDKKPVVYDIGANTGYYSISTAFTHGADVVAFEPLEEHVACIRESVTLNKLDEFVKIFTCALGDLAEERDFYLGGSGSSLNPDFLGDPEAVSRKVTVDTLDTIIAREKLPNPDFIKIDVEGHELSVLRGAEIVLQSIKPVLFVEISSSLHSLGRNFKNEQYEETFDLLSSKGYVPYQLTGSVLRRHDIRTLPKDGLHMYLFLHPETHASLATVLGISFS